MPPDPSPAWEWVLKEALAGATTMPAFAAIRVDCSASCNKDGRGHQHEGAAASATAAGHVVAG